MPSRPTQPDHALPSVRSVADPAGFLRAGGSLHAGVGHHQGTPVVDLIDAQGNLLPFGLGFRSVGGIHAQGSADVPLAGPLDFGNKASAGFFNLRPEPFRLHHQLKPQAQIP